MGIGKNDKVDGSTKTIGDNFADWEGDTFGFGYGTGEPYIVPAVRTLLSCCDGENDSYNYDALEASLGQVPAWLLINTMGHADMIEYGTSPRHGWLTPTGKALKLFMLGHTNEELLGMIAGNENEDTCTPNTCNCGPSGYWEGHVCVNPFWQADAARKLLADSK